MLNYIKKIRSYSFNKYEENIRNSSDILEQCTIL